jgi:hypothetical protein
MPITFLKDVRVKRHISVDDPILFEYAPAIGGNALMLYLMYCSLAEKYQRVFPSYDSLRRQTGFGSDTITKCNRILEEVGLIKIERKMQHSEGGKAKMRDRNIYYLLEPRGLTFEQKAKHLPKDYQPLVKFSVTPETGVTITPEIGVAVAPETGVTTTPETGVYTNTVVVNSNNNKTTTILLLPLIKKMQKLLGWEDTMLDEITKGMETTYRNSLKNGLPAEIVTQRMEEKIVKLAKSIKEAKNPLAFFHNAVLKDWTDLKEAKAQAKDKNQEALKAAEDAEARHKQTEWEKLAPLQQAKYYELALKFEYQKNHHRRPPSPEELNELIQTLADTGHVGNVSLRFPAPTFNPNEVE